MEITSYNHHLKAPFFPVVFVVKQRILCRPGPSFLSNQSFATESRGCLSARFVQAQRVGMYNQPVPKGLIRIYGQADWHFITCSCYRRQPFMNSAYHRDLFLKILEETRKKYQFIVAGYVVMPEHFHLLIGEPRIKNPSASDAGIETAGFAQVP
jgi:Transposase IS200 like